MPSRKLEGPSVVCPTCTGAMLYVAGCRPRPTALTRREELGYLHRHGWAEKDIGEIAERCRDCGATVDGYHHPQCCVAICTEHGQRLMCSCDVNPVTQTPYH